jgi:hypothetical protein
MLKSRTMWPPQGWRFRQPETGWSAKGGQGFSQVVDAIISHRQQNPRFKLSTDRATVENELDDYTCAILKNNQHWCVGESVASFSGPLPAFPRLSEAKRSGAAGAANFVSNAVVGIKVWMDLFGEGKVVEKSLAEERAAVCYACPLNERTNLAQKFTAAAVKEIMGIFQMLNDLNLETSKDSQLNVCSACSCALKAKVWAPFKIIKKHITQDAWNALHPSCWMRKEDQAQS